MKDRKTGKGKEGRREWRGGEGKGRDGKEGKSASWFLGGIDAPDPARSRLLHSEC
jgi:hypothetical protein